MDDAYCVPCSSPPADFPTFLGRSEAWGPFLPYYSRDCQQRLGGTKGEFSDVLNEGCHAVTFFLLNAGCAMILKALDEGYIKVFKS